MKSPFYFIVESLINKRYNNTKSISGLDIIISTSEEDYISSNRLAKVIEVPLGYSGPITPGDILLVHHNVFKFYFTCELISDIYNYFAERNEDEGYL